MPIPETILKAFNRGLDLKSPGHLIPDGFCADLRNVRLTSGVPEKIAGYVPLLVGSTRPPDGGDVLFVAQHIVAPQRHLLLFTSNGYIYDYDDAATTFTLRRRIAIGTNAWSSVTFGSTKIVSDGVNRPYRIESTGQVTPLADKFLAGFEAAEIWTTGLGVTTSGADTRLSPIAFVEGAQGQRFTWAAATASTASTATGAPFDILTSPYSVAPNFGATDPGAAQVLLRAYVNSGQANYVRGRIRFGDAAQLNYREFLFPPTLAAGENLLVMPIDGSVVVGTPLTTSSAAVTITMSTAATGPLDVTFDDLRIGYVSGPQAASAYTEVHKSIYWQTGVASVPFRVFFSNANNPSFHTTTDVLDIFDKSGADTRVENRALKSFFDTLIVGTRNTIFGINGSDRTTFTLSEQSSGQGITAHRSLISFGDTFLYRFQNGIYAYSVSQLQSVSLPVEPLLDAYDETFVTVAHRWIERKTMLFTYRQTGATPYLLAYDYGSGQRGWIAWDIPATAIFPYVDGNGNDLILTVNTDGILYLHDQGAQFNGAEFDALVTTRWLGADTAAHVRKWVRVMATVLLGATAPVLFSWRVANDPAQFVNATWSTEVSLDVTSVEEGTFVDMGDFGRFLQLRFRQTTSAGLLVHLFPLGIFPIIPAGLAGFVGASGGAFRLEPPIDVKSYLLPRRT